LEDPEEQPSARAGFSRRKWIGIAVAAVVAAFLVGFLPMWLKDRETSHRLAAADASVRSVELHALIGDAAIDARRGDYEPARQEISKFFTDLRSELDRGDDSAFTKAQRERLEALLVGRDDLVTLLARSDAASGGRLADLHAGFRQALAAEPQPLH
jgi:hypothetical protein